MKILVWLGILIFSCSAFAMNGRTTYQARIVKPDGYALEAASVTFKFSVLDTVGSCVLYSETYSAVDMRSTGGLISFALGNGVRDFPASGTTAVFSNVFDNSINSMPCQTPGIYNPLANDTRRIVMQFNDGNGWQTLPAMTINAVPYAMYATKSNDSKTLNGKADTAFVEASTLAALNCTATQAIKFNNATFSCIDVSASGSGGITSVTTSGSVLSTGGTASAPVISIQAATLSQDGYLTSLDYAEFKAKLSASSTQIINTLGYTPVSSSTVASQIASSTLAGDVSGNPGSNTVNSVGGKSSGQISTSVDDTLAATSSATADAIVRRNSSGNATFNDVYANAAKINYVDIYKPSTSFNVRLQAPTSLAANYVLNLPTTSGTTGQVLSTDGSGNLLWINPSTGSVVSVSATAPLASTGGSNPTISISQATASTNGYLSSADWNTFNNKQQATSAAIIATLGYTPADNSASGTYAQKVNNLSDLTNIPQARTNLGLGTFATASTLDLGSASATGTLDIARLPAFIGDATIAAASNTIVLSNSGVIAGTYTKVTVDSKGRVTSSSALSSSDVTTALGYTPATSTTLAASFVQKTGDTMTGLLNLKAGSATIAPLKFTSGTLLSSAQSGTVEYDGSQLYFTDGSNTRRALVTNSTPGSFDNTSSISNASGNITLSPNNITGSVIVNSSAASISSGTGALVVNGGIGVGGSINAGGNLDLAGSATIGQSLTLSSMTSGSVLFAGANGVVSENNSKLFWDGANQRLGVGTSAPSTVFHVAGSSSSALVQVVNALVSTASTAEFLQPALNSLNGTGIVIGRSASLNDAGWINYYHHGTQASRRIAIGHYGATDKLSILNNGYIGVGTSAPTQLMTLSGANIGMNFYDTTYANTLIRLSNSGGNGNFDLYAGATSVVKFSAQNNINSYVNSGANFGVGMTTPGSRLVVKGADATSVTSSLNVTDSANTSLLFVRNDGNIGIGTAAPTQILDVVKSSGDGFVRMKTNDIDSDSGLIAQNDVQTWKIYNKAGYSDALVFEDVNAGLQAMTIKKSTGYVGLGTTNPSALLHLSNGDPSFIIENTMASSNALFKLKNPSRTWQIGLRGADLSDAFAIRNETAGGDLFTIQPAGNIGIGTTGPEAKLHIAQSITAQNATSGSAQAWNGNSQIKISSGNNALALSVVGTFNQRLGIIQAGHGGDGVNAYTDLTDPKLALQPYGGNVGIGTSAPTQRLEVSGKIKTSDSIIMQNGSQNSPLLIGADIGASTLTDSITKRGYIGVPHYLNAERNVLHSYVESGSTYSNLLIGGGNSAYNAVTAMLFYTGATNTTSSGVERMRIDANGNVGIGDSSPTQPLEIEAAGAAVSKRVIMRNSNNTGAAGFTAESGTNSLSMGTWGQSAGSVVTYIEANSSAGLKMSTWTNTAMTFHTNGSAGGVTERMRISNTGQVGIGTTAPSYTLDVSGTLRVTGTAYTNGGYTTWTAASDRRLKDIHGSYNRGLDDILGINTIKFQYKADNKIGLDSSKEFVGVTAQNLQTAIPEAVTEETNGKLKGYLTINTTPVLWTLVNAVKQLYKQVMERFETHDRQIASIVASKADKAEIEMLKQKVAEVDALKSKSDKLEAENAALKSYLCSKDPAAPICK